MNKAEIDNELFRSLADTLPHLAWIAKPDGHIYWYNKRWFEYTGTSLESMEGWGWQDVHDPKTLPSVMERWNASLSSGQPFEMTFTLKGSDGEFRYFLTRATPFYNKQGEIRHWFGTNTDITEIKRYEEEQSDARSRLDSILAAAEVGSWEFDPVNNAVIADRNLARMFGISPEDAQGGPIEAYLEAIHPEDRDAVTQRLSRALISQESYEAEYRIVQKEGSVRWVVARGRVERDDSGKAIRLPGVVVDFTAQWNVEQDLRASEEKRRLALDSARMGSWNIEVATNSLSCDTRFREIFHGSDLPITYEEAFAALHPDDRERVRDSVDQATQPEGPGVYSEEYRVIHPDGSIRWVLGSGRANFIESEAGRQISSLDGTVLDITNQKKTEEDLRAFAARLSEADRRKDEFLATLAHELRNPLAPIRTGLEVLKMAKDDPVLVEEIRSTMERQAQQMIRLIDDLLEVSRITQGKLELRTCQISISDIVRSAVEAAQPFIDDSNHELTVSLPSRPIYIDGDPHRLAQVISNLINNSAKYTPGGGRIWLTVERLTNEVTISVKDTGIGIPLEMQHTIFEMFSQIDRSREVEYKGLGIGLTLVKRLIEMHGGSVSVFSEGVNQGTEFIVRLPVLANSEVEMTERSNTNEATNQGPLRVLVVDDNGAAATMLGMVVKLLGHEVRTAGDGIQAIKTAEEFLPQVIFMDIGMPKMNGYEAAKQIRKQLWGQSICLIALTGWGQDQDRLLAIEAGFDHHLVKPAEPSEIQRLLGQVKN